MQATSLDSHQVQFFFDEGYLIIPDLFDRRDLNPLQHEMAGQIDRTIQRLAGEGKIRDLHADEPFETRLAMIYADSRGNGEAIMADLEGVAGGGYTGRQMFNLLSHPKLLAGLQPLIGPEIVASSTYRIRPKIPGTSRGVVPWHQDSGYFEAHCDRHLIITCWIPLVDANERNGCMKILPRSHRRGIFTHHTGGNANFLVINDQDLPSNAPAPVTAECPMGGVVLMTNMTPHCSMPNDSNIVRWSVDLRYQSADVPNNVGLWPPLDQKPEGEMLMACYPPEADFIVASQRDPSRVADYETFVSRRRHFDAVKEKVYPRRGWTAVGAAS